MSEEKIWDHDRICPECLTTYSRACPDRRPEHNHSAWCIDIDDIRQLICGCYAHKECQKSGPLHDCRIP